MLRKFNLEISSIVKFSLISTLWYLALANLLFNLLIWLLSRLSFFPIFVINSVSVKDDPPENDSLKLEEFKANWIPFRS